VPFKEISDLMHEGVFVANLQARHPPLIHVGLLATVIGHVNGTPATQRAFHFVIEPLQSVQIVQVPFY